MRPHQAIADQFRARLQDLHAETGGRVVAAVSGGRDSVVLLHLLRFRSGLGPESIVVAHFDHRMRPGSASDGEWVQGLCRAWGVECLTGATTEILRSEAEARRARYDFLFTARAQANAGMILTAHHADDQAETVLFRALRGAGPRGLSGIRDVRSPGIGRPLLPFSRRSITDYARSARLSHREDPTNLDIEKARNRLRLDILPRIEEGVASGARRALVRLGDVMQNLDEAVSVLAESALESSIRERSDGELALDRVRLMDLPEPARAQVLRAAARRLGLELDHAGTRLALEVSSDGASGKRVDLGGGLTLGREFDLLRFFRPGPRLSDVSIRIEGPGAGRAELRLDGRTWTACWSDAELADTRLAQCFSLERLSFPLTVRGWRPGDRMLLPYGTKKLKKLFQEARLPRTERHRRPLVVDAAGAVLWAPAVASAPLTQAGASEPLFHVGFDDD